MNLELEKEKLIKDYEKIINYVIKKYNLQTFRDELFDLGMIGFVQGINSYNENKNSGLLNYVITCIENEFKKNLQSNNRKKRIAKVVSYNAKIGETDTELIELIGYIPNYDRELYLQELMRVVNCEISFMTVKQQLLINYLYGLNGFKMLSVMEIADKFNVTKQNVNQAKNVIIRKLKKALIKFEKNYREGLYDKEDNIQTKYF